MKHVKVIVGNFRSGSAFRDGPELSGSSTNVVVVCGLPVVRPDRRLKAVRASNNEAERFATALVFPRGESGSEPHWSRCVAVREDLSSPGLVKRRRALRGRNPTEG